MPQRKAKLKRQQATPEFDFVAPFNLYESMDRLSQVQELREIPFVPKLRISFDLMNDDTCKFIIQRSGPDSLKLHGYLNRLDDEKTYVSGETQMTKQTFGETGLIVALILLLSPFIGWFVGLILLGGLAAFIHYYRQGVQAEQGRLEKLLKDTLAREGDLYFLVQNP